MSSLRFSCTIRSSTGPLAEIHASRMPGLTVFEREDDGGYSVWVPSLPGCASMGDTKAEALRNIKEAIALHGRALLS